MLRRSCFAFIVAAFTAVACSSLPDLGFEQADGGGGGEGGADTGADTAACVKSGPEVCDDGIDNDCNGMTDCADPACGGFACTLPAPDSWELVALADATQPTCPVGFTGSTDLKVLNGVATHTCPCSCTGSGGSGPTCAGATMTVTTGDDPACTAAQTMAVLNANTAACTPTPNDLTIGSASSTGFGKITPPVGPATCTPMASITKTDPTSGRSCSAPTKLGLGCSGLTRCVPRATGFSMCIAKAGDQVCPTGFTAKRLIAGISATDTRACAPCTCTNSPCVGDVQLWANSMACNAGKKSVLTTAGNSTCAAPQAGSDPNVATAKFYKSTMMGGCGVGTPAVKSGELSFAGPRTICCN